MSPFIRRVALATAVSFLGLSHIASAQISFGIGSAAHREAEARILHLLESRDSFVAEDMPFTKFVQSLRDRFNINVHLDRKALDDFGIDTATPITIQLRDATLESSLHHVLEQLELTWTIRHETLVITTPEEAEAHLDTRVYPVRDLVLIEFERTVDADFDTLIDTITSTLHADSWDQVGGPGAIEPEPASMSLVISQTWSVHRELDQLLTTIRAARDRQGISAVRRGSQPAAVASPQPRPAIRYKRPTNSTWQLPRVYE